MSLPDQGGEVHIVLLGDSTLDNGRYLNLGRGELSVEKQLTKRCAEHGWDMTVLAQDGSMLEDVRQRQLPLIPECATHIVLSASGNDLLALLNQMVVSNFTLASVYSAVVAGLKRVAESYKDILQTLKSTGRHLACCTVYRPNFNHLFFKTLAIFSLGLHNSRIRGISTELDISVIDLSVLFDPPTSEDFATPLELSTRGGAKFAENISNFVRDHALSSLRTHRYKRAPSILYADDDTYQPTGNSRFAAPMTCCATRAPSRRVYADKSLSKLEALDEAHAGISLGPALGFSDNQQPWRESS